MEKKSVLSSNLKTVGYDSKTKILEIEFHNGTIYQYFNVPETIFNGLMSANSKGSYFDSHIKKVPFQYRKVR